MNTHMDYMEVLGNLAQYINKKLVFKIGGETIDNEERLRKLVEQIIVLSHFNIRCYVVHGGGKQLSTAQKDSNIPAKFDEQGDRITTAASLEITKRVMQMLNARIVNMFEDIKRDMAREHDVFHGVKIDGMETHGVPLNAIRKNTETVREENFVGLPKGIDSDSFVPLTTKGIHVLSCLGHQIGQKDQLLNMNGDRAALALAQSLTAQRLIFITDVAGVMTEKPTEENRGRIQLYSKISTHTALRLAENGTAVNGMAMKLRMAARAIETGQIRAVVMQQAGATLEELLTDVGKGTQIVPKNQCPVPIMAPLPR